MKKILYLPVFILFFCSQTYAQKVKYDDLFALLSTKKYESAEPFLRTFLAEEKNNDHANAHLQMGILYEYKSSTQDVLTHSAEKLSYLDSALLYLKKAQVLIDDKEVRKNDELYQAYQRRDVRTGKIGIKLADVQLDIDNKIKNINERQDNIKRLVAYYNDMISSYDSARYQFTEARNSFPTMKALLFQSGADTENKLLLIKDYYQKFLEAYKSYKNTTGTIGKYDQSLNEKLIENFETEGESETDFKLDVIEVWNYEAWYDGVVKVKEKDITTIKEELIKVTSQLDNLRAKLVQDSTELKESVDLTSFGDKIHEYDRLALPLQVLKYKSGELDYLSFLMSAKQYSDSLDISYQIEILQKRVSHCQGLKSKIESIEAIDIDEESKNYNEWLEKFFVNASSLKNYVAEKATWVKTELDKNTQLYEDILVRDKWLINENDSIPLYLSEDLTSPYKPLLIEDHATAGVRVGEVPTGYFVKISPAKTTEGKIEIILPKDFNLDSDALSVLLTSDEDGLVDFVIYDTPGTEGTLAVISKIYKVDGLAWTKSFTLENGVTAAAYKAGNLELQLEEGEKVVIDKKGNMVETK